MPRLLLCPGWLKRWAQRNRWTKTLFWPRVDGSEPRLIMSNLHRGFVRVMVTRGRALRPGWWRRPMGDCS